MPSVAILARTVSTPAALPADVGRRLLSIMAAGAGGGDVSGGSPRRAGSGGLPPGVAAPSGTILDYAILYCLISYHITL